LDFNTVHNQAIVANATQSSATKKEKKHLSKQKSKKLVLMATLICNFV